MKKQALTFIIGAFVISGFAQESKQLSIDEAVAGMYKNKTLQQIHWRGTTEQFTWVDNDVLFTSDAKGSKPKEFLLLSDLNKITGKQWTAFPQYDWLGSDTLLLNSGNEFLRYIVKTKKIDTSLVIDNKAKHITYNQHFEFAYTIENNLFLAANGANTALTNYKDGVVVADEINRKEFNTDEAIFWSPSGKLLAYMEKIVKYDEPYPLVDYSTQPAKLKTTWYPFAGGKNEIVRVAIYNPATKTTKYLNTGKSDQYITNIVWDDNEQSISVVLVNREQNKLSVRMYSSETGDQQAVLLEEKSDKYVEPEHGIIPVPKRNGEFLWLSERNGYNHLYHYTTDGQLLGQITNGNWEITNIIGFNSQGDVIYFEGTTEENPCERHIYKANIFSLDVKCLTNSIQGTHEGFLNPALNVLLDYTQSQTNCGSLSIIDSKAVKLLKQAESPISNYILPNYRFFSMLAADQKTKLYAALITPPNFDSTKKYPVIIDVYGGPHLQCVTNTWLNGGILPNLFAQEGYIVLMLDNRGSYGRGQLFEQQTWHQLGTVEMEDQMCGYNWLTQQQYVDSARIATYGWSFGGFMSLSLLTTYPNKFACGIAGSPVCDWKLYEIMYTERYMGTPANNQAGYEKASVISKAKYMKAPLYIINGGIDNVTVSQNSLSFINECISNNIDVDYMVYPLHDHNVRGKDLVHHVNKMIRFYNTHLQPTK